MDTTPMRRQPSVQVNEHSGFAIELAQYLKAVLRDEGLSGRKFADMAAAGTHDHWAKILACTKVMTTNDVKVVADALGVDPYVFVAAARAHASTEHLFSVSGSRQDGNTLTPKQERAIRQSDHKLAALRGRNEADVKHKDD